MLGWKLKSEWEVVPNHSPRCFAFARDVLSPTMQIGLPVCEDIYVRSVKRSMSINCPINYLILDTTTSSVGKIHNPACGVH